MDGNLPVVQILDLGNIMDQTLPSLDAGFWHPCQNDGLFIKAFAQTASCCLAGQ